MGQDNYKNYLRYKWALLRRNKNYQEDFKILQRSELWQKWGCWLNPALPAESAIKKLHFPVRSISEEEAAPEFYRMFGDILEAEAVEEKDNTRRPKRIVLSIDMGAPYDLVMSCLENLFTSTDIYQPIVRNDKDVPVYQRTQLPTKRIQWEKLDDMFKIFDMKNGGKKIRQIAEELLPNNKDGEREIKKRLARIRKMIKSVKLW
jgi:hypothetical protein